jgi:hypothetical protein
MRTAPLLADSSAVRGVILDALGGQHGIGNLEHVADAELALLRSRVEKRYVKLRIPLV